MRKVSLAPLTILMATAFWLVARQIAGQLLQHAIVIDTRAGTPQITPDDGYDLAQAASPYMDGILKMRKTLWAKTSCGSWAG